MKLGILIVAAIGIVAVAVALYFAFGQEEQEIAGGQPAPVEVESTDVSPSPPPESGSLEPAEEPAAEETQAAAEDPAAPEDTVSQSSPAEGPALEPTGEDSSGETATAIATAPATESVAEPLPAGSKAKASFDLVRVEKSGEAVIAGRAPAGSRVTIFDGEEALGAVVVGPSGGWVVLPDDPLSPGSHHLSIRAELADGSEIWSENSAVVEVPEPEVQVATADPSQPASEADEEPESVQKGAVGAHTADSEPAASGEAEQAGPLVVLVPTDPDQPSEVLQVPETPAEEGIRQDSLSLDTVDYDDAGRAVISGRATPGSIILVYLDNLAVADTVVDSDGRWSVRPDSPISPGLHRLRVDQLAADGAVLARVETPFARAEVEEIQVAGDRVVVQPGNSLWRIARRVYGEGIRYTVIYQANSGEIGDPDLIYPGQIFDLPSAE